MTTNPVNIKAGQPYTGQLKKDIQLVGTNQADEVRVQNAKGGQVYTGAGTDKIDIKGSGDILGIQVGDGNDEIKVQYDNAKKVDLFGEGGNDRLTFKGKDNGLVRIGMIEGDNKTTIQSGSNNNTFRIYTGKGNNELTMQNSENNNLTFYGEVNNGQALNGTFKANLYGDKNIYNGYTGDTKDTVRVNGDGNTFGGLDLGAGDDEISIAGEGNNGTIKTGAGNDKVKISGKDNNLIIETSGQEDTIELAGNANDWTQSTNGNGERVYRDNKGNVITVRGDGKVVDARGNVIGQAAPPQGDDGSTTTVPGSGERDEADDRDSSGPGQPSNPGNTTDGPIAGDDGDGNPSTTTTAQTQQQQDALQFLIDNAGRIPSDGSYNENDFNRAINDPSVKPEHREFLRQIRDNREALTYLDGRRGDLNAQELTDIKRLLSQGYTLDEIIKAGESSKRTGSRSTLLNHTVSPNFKSTQEQQNAQNGLQGALDRFDQYATNPWIGSRKLDNGAFEKLIADTDDPATREVLRFVQQNRDKLSWLDGVRGDLTKKELETILGLVQKGYSLEFLVEEGDLLKSGRHGYNGTQLGNIR